MTLADVLADGLARAAAPRIFGVVGDDGARPIVEAAERRGLPCIRAHGAAAACIMAAVTGELADAPGVAVASFASDLTEGLRQASLERAPLLVISELRDPAGASATGRATGLTRDTIAKARLAVEPGSAAHWIAHATQLAMTEPRGPVWLEVTAEDARRPTLPMATTFRPAPLPPPDTAALDEAARLLAAAARPLLVAGVQCRSHESAKWVRALAEALPAAVQVTPKARGVLPDLHPLHLGLFTGDALGDPLLAQADLVVTIGVDAVEIVPPAWPLAVPVVHLAPAPHGGAGYRPRLEVIGEIALLIEELAPRLRGRARADWDVAELDRLKRGYVSRFVSPVIARGSRLSRRRAVEIVRELAAPGTVAVLEGGALQAAVAASWPVFAPREFVTPNGSSLEFALCAAIAAQLVHDGRPVVCFASGAGVHAASAELRTMARLARPILVVAWGGTAGADPEIDLVTVAQEQGVPAASVGTEAELRLAVTLAFAAGGPYLITDPIAP